jgi:hypothetical protein
VRATTISSIAHPKGHTIDDVIDFDHYRFVKLGRYPSTAIREEGCTREKIWERARAIRITRRSSDSKKSTTSHEGEYDLGTNLPSINSSSLEQLLAPGDRELDARFDGLELALEVLLGEELDQTVLVLGVLKRGELERRYKNTCRSRTKKIRGRCTRKINIKERNIPRKQGDCS